MQSFKEEVDERIVNNGLDKMLKKASDGFMEESIRSLYSYNFSWMGRPIIQYPQDIMAMQELVWEIKPDLIIETGIAHGGSLILYASLLELNAVCGGPMDARVLGIDIDIREHNRLAIEAHPMFSRITMIEGSSVDPAIIAQVQEIASKRHTILVCLDSNHTHDHVLAELEAYAPLVSRNSYCVVFDTIVDDLPAEMYPDRPWGPGNNPKTAVWEYLQSHPEFAIDKMIQDKLLVTVAADGYLKRIG